MAEIITYETLREIQRNERKSEKLTELSDEFYRSVKEYLSRKISDEITETEIRNARMILEDIRERREKKILNQALRAVRSNEKVETNGMTSEEKGLFEKIVELLKEYKKKNQINETTLNERQTKTEEIEQIEKDIKRDVESEEIKESKDYIKVKILEDVPQIVGADLKDYGPFKAGEVVKLPTENARIFIEMGKAEEEK